MKQILAGFAAAIALVMVMAQVQPSMRIVLRDEGTAQGRAGILNIVGSYGTAAVSGNVGTITIASPTTTEGDLIYRGASADTRLAKGSALQYLRLNAGNTAPEWGTADSVLLFGGGNTSTGHAPLDATNYYLSASFGFDPSVADTTAGISMPTCRVTAAYITVSVFGTLATAGQNASFYVRKNSTTEALISNAVPFSAATNLVSNTSLNFSLTGGDRFYVKFLTPTWTTNPTAVFYAVSLVLSVP